MEALKRCPFCGGRAKISYDIEFNCGTTYLKTRVQCTECRTDKMNVIAVNLQNGDVIKKWSECRDLAIEEWNKRYEEKKGLNILEDDIHGEQRDTND